MASNKNVKFVIAKNSFVKKVVFDNLEDGEWFLLPNGNVCIRDGDLYLDLSSFDFRHDVFDDAYEENTELIPLGKVEISFPEYKGGLIPSRYKV